MQLPSTSPDSPASFQIRPATVSDGSRIWQLVRDCQVLETNTCYAYLLICRDFGATSLVAYAGDDLLGFVAAYIPPARPDSVFVWQIGTAAAARRKGVGKALLRALVESDACRDVQYLEATVAVSNEASRGLFRGLANEWETGFDVQPGFRSSDFGPVTSESHSPHEAEDLLRIGPLQEKKATP